MGVSWKSYSRAFPVPWHDDSRGWFRTYGEQCEFEANGLMWRREASINEVPILVSEPKFLWPAAPRPANHSELTEFGFCDRTAGRQGAAA